MKESIIKELYEILNEIRKNTDAPVARIQYTRKDKFDNIQLGSSIPIEFSNLEESIDKMYVISIKEGFMFFNNSTKGKAWIEENSKSISEALTNLVLSNKINF